ncbi:AAA family ATPase [Arhodomonas aquaeolei]|uniref:AAA family ATPase n=1 Tax=Arhodomonas aquaeolei TaxID=2369 RepID=UPI0003807AD7|nr:AAA family ATPase [Arhodomonas aquaeolei]
MDRRVGRVLERAGDIILGKDHSIRLSLACLLAGGHLLIEDLPGVGKTTLAHVLARLLGLEMQRVQFTSDLLPADILGASIYDREVRGFHFHPGPVFTQLLLADEINRATPKTQSALLEAMEEHQVTVDGTTHALPAPFFVIATQNPADQTGTYPLPESQLDRFLMSLALGYPDRAAERELLLGADRRQLIDAEPPVLGDDDLDDLRAAVHRVHVAGALVDYVQALLRATRNGDRPGGLSPRAGLALMQAARAWAFTGGDTAVLPEHVQAVFPHVAAHRLQHPGEGLATARERCGALLADVPIP